MEHGAPSRTAFAVAQFRAGHQILDGGEIFPDPYAVVLLGEQLEAIATELARDPDNHKARAYMATRSRIGEEWLHASYRRGVRQMVIWERLAAAKLSIPPTLTFVPADFSTDHLSSVLARFGVNLQEPAFFLWLGVVPYLKEETIFSTLACIAAIEGSEVVFDYSEPLENYPAQQQPYIKAISDKVASMGEPWLSCFDGLAARVRE